MEFSWSDCLFVLMYYLINYRLRLFLALHIHFDGYLQQPFLYNFFSVFKQSILNIHLHISEFFFYLNKNLYI